MIQVVFCLTMIAAIFRETDTRTLTKEVSTMLSFDHPNVMSLIGLCLDTGVPLIIMPFMANGSVLEYVKSHKKEFCHPSNAENEVEVSIKAYIKS